MLQVPNRLRIGFTLAAIGMATAGFAPRQLTAQEGGCTFLPGTSNLSFITLAGGPRIYYMSTPRIACPDGVRITADSAVTYESENMTYLTGHVRYSDATRVLNADQARYFARLGRLQASGNLVVRDTAQGSVIEGGTLIYLRRTDFRAEEEMDVVTGSDQVRPRALLYMKPGADTLPPEPAGPSDTAAVADSLTTPDTAAVRDTVAAADTGVVADTTLVARDTAAAADTTLVARDTTAARDTLAAPDTSVTQAPAHDTVAASDATHIVGRPAAARADSAVTSDTLAGRGTLAAPDTAVATPADTVQTPYEVLADRIHLQGDHAFDASGNVVINHDSLVAHAQVAQYDQLQARLRLFGDSRVDGEAYALTADTIDLSLPGGQVRSVRAIRHGKLVGQDVDLTAPVIQVFTRGGTMDRLVAISPPPPEAAEEGAGATTQPPDSTDLARPVATAQKVLLTADSIEVNAPKQVLDRIFAAGDARGESTAGDSLNVEALPEVARKDWLEGDTVIATFKKAEPAPGQPPDSAGYDLERLVARGNARSLYRLPPNDSTSKADSGKAGEPPSLSYVVGSIIEIVMNAGEVDSMKVEGAVKGWHWEPTRRAPPGDTIRPDSAKRAAGDTLAPPDTAAVPDTSRVPLALARAGSSAPSPPPSRSGAPFPGGRALPASRFQRASRRRSAGR